MKFGSLFFLGLFLLLSCSAEEDGLDTARKSEFAIVVHGGAGSMQQENLDNETEYKYKMKMNDALHAGYDILNEGGSSLDAVEAAVKVLEDSPLFNAGKGAVFNNDGINELDASIMDGANLNAGAVARVTSIKNPVSAARLVMEKSPHVLLVGDGAEKFAKENSLEPVDKKYFYTEKRFRDYERIKNKKKSEKKKAELVKAEPEKFGTVGAVALDKNGNLAAATSTGGMTNKMYGRVGDSPIIGAGTYANNKTCAVSATGHGEYFIRNVIAYDLSALMEYSNLSLEEAADSLINGKLKSQKANGGLIALDTLGNVAMPFNTGGMFRAYMLDDGLARVKIFADEEE